ncbi:hypothetical protein JCM1840_007430 [Sporobolomyces johnsonii]
MSTPVNTWIITSVLPTPNVLVAWTCLIVIYTYAIVAYLASLPRSKLHTLCHSIAGSKLIHLFFCFTFTLSVINIISDTTREDDTKWQIQ